MSKLKGIVVEVGNTGNGTKISEEGLKSISDQDIPVNWNFDINKPLGTARTKMNEDGQLEVEISLYPEELLPKGSGAIIDKLFPAIGGKITQSHTRDGFRLIDKVEIASVSLSNQPNADPLIKSIGEQIKSDKLI